MRALLAAAVVMAATPAVAQTVAERMQVCLACHGEKGQSTHPEVPSLGAQQKDYVLTQLYMFREKLRNVALMNEMAKGLSDDDLRAIAESIAKLPPPPPAAGGDDAARIARAKALVDGNRCNSCHASNFAGQDQVPRLAGQREDYLVKALREYKSGARPGYDPAMASVVAPLQDRDFVDLAYYLARSP
ncbi:MAG TPA: c-type cytochrome [Xanthobacteraceae bacterium]|nr:c-type cytochrome [Xanthobacteraceae bacterium]